MRTVHKYELKVADENVIAMPIGCEMLAVQVQHGVPCLWAIVDTALPDVRVKILTYGTGHEIVGHPGRYVGTYQLESGSLVFHVFEAS